MADKLDLLIRGGRLIDPRNGIDALCDVGFRQGAVAAVGRDIAAAGATRTIEAHSRIVAPGLVDLHAHVYHDGTPLGVDARKVARTSGVTTFVDAGSAGAANFAGFRNHVIAPSDVRILAYLNVSYPGIFGWGPGIMVGECLDRRLLHFGEAVRVGRANRDLIVGIKVRIGFGTSGDLGAHPLDIALDIADELELPVMAHIGAPPPHIDEVLRRLRKGDVLTHCFRSAPNAVVRRKVPREIYLEARRRGVIMDIGHGSGSFGFDTCRAMMDAGYPPDVISSDIHKMSIKGPAYDLLVTMSKFLNLGMSEAQVIAASTAAPAAAALHPELGQLAVGAAGDACVLSIEDGAFPFEDCSGETMVGSRRFALHEVIFAGAPLI